MLQDFYIAVFTHNAKLFSTLEHSARNIGVPIDLFSYRDRFHSVLRMARGRHLIALFHADQEREACLHWIRALCDSDPDAFSVWVEQNFNQKSIASAVRAGARDMLVGDVSHDEFCSLLKRATDFFTKPRISSRVIAVLGASGGCGASTVAANLASEISALKSTHVAVLDLDPCTSGIGVMLNLCAEATLFDLYEHANSLDVSLIERAAAAHSSGISLIASSRWPAEQLPIPDSIIRRVILLMEQAFPYVVLDVPRKIFPESQTPVDAAEAFVVVTPFSLIGAAGASHAIQALQSFGYPEERVFWVANAVSRPNALSVSQLRRVMVCKPFAQIPFGPDVVIRAGTEGRCCSQIAARASITKCFQNLARRMCQSFDQLDRESSRDKTDADRITLFNQTTGASR